MLSAIARQSIYILVLAPGLGWAEGAVRQFDCTIVRSCDGSGSCAALNGTVSFSMAPVSTAPDGSGRFEIKYGPVRTAMHALSDTGPFHWKIGDEQNTLLLNSEREVLWHQLNIGTPARATVRFMTCRYQP
jgi:hypothetical protein